MSVSDGEGACEPVCEGGEFSARIMGMTTVEG